MGGDRLPIRLRPFHLVLLRCQCVGKSIYDPRFRPPTEADVQSLIAQGSEYPLRKPPGFHWDFFLLGITTFIAGLLGTPAPNGASFSRVISLVPYTFANRQVSSRKHLCTLPLSSCWDTKIWKRILRRLSPTKRQYQHRQRLGVPVELESKIMQSSCLQLKKVTVVIAHSHQPEQLVMRRPEQDLCIVIDLDKLSRASSEH